MCVCMCVAVRVFCSFSSLQEHIFPSCTAVITAHFLAVTHTYACCRSPVRATWSYEGLCWNCTLTCYLLNADQWHVCHLIMSSYFMLLHTDKTLKYISLQGKIKNSVHKSNNSQLVRTSFKLKYSHLNDVELTITCKQDIHKNVCCSCKFQNHCWVCSYKSSDEGNSARLYSCFSLILSKKRNS